MFTVAVTENFGNHPDGKGALYSEFQLWDKQSANVWRAWQEQKDDELSLVL